MPLAAAGIPDFEVQGYGQVKLSAWVCHVHANFEDGTLGCRVTCAAGRRIDKPR